MSLQYSLPEKSLLKTESSESDSESIDIDTIDTLSENINNVVLICSDSDNKEELDVTDNTDNNPWIEKKKKPKKEKKAPEKYQIRPRVTIYLNDDDTKPVTAAGALLYKKVGDSMKLLLIETKGKYEDIGGKIDPVDKDIIDAAAREVEEETNGLIKGESIKDRLKVAPYIYVPRSKYVIFIIEANVSEKKLKKEDFGDREIHDNFARTIGWISREELTKPATVQHKLNWRLKSKSLFDKLIEIDKQLKLKPNIFKKI